MRSIRNLIVILSTLLLGAPSILIPLGSANEGVEVHGVSAAKEDYERDVDSVAMASQEQAIAKLSNLLKKYRGSSQEPILLSKLAELQQQNAAILFRIAHGRAHRSGGEVNLGKFKRTMNQAISTLSTLIAKYPSYSEISHAYFMRGKGYEEIENKQAAAKDYTYLVNRFPLAEEATSAYMSLADFGIDANDHLKAIAFLKEVEKRPEDPHYPFALYKLAWSYYNLKDIPTSLHYAETQIHYYDDLKNPDTSEISDTPLVANSDGALRENTLLDTTVFYFEGYEKDAVKYSPENALAYFHKLERGPVIGHMLLRYSKLLRSHAHDADLVLWKNLVMKEELSGEHHPETLDIVLNTYEHVLDRRDYAELTRTAQDIVTLYDEAKSSKFGMYESMPKAQKILLDTAENMQTVIVKNKDADGVGPLSQTLASIYFAFVKVVDEADPRIPGVHYNLAETLFAIRNYDEATTHYRWVVDHGNWKKSFGTRDKKSVSVADSSLKAIAARYETLSKAGLLPKDVTAVSLVKNSEAPLPPLLEQWVGWIDEHLRHSTENTDNFIFEANRALYHNNHVADAIRRLSAFSEDHPKSQFAIPSATLVIDTYIATADWNLLLQKSENMRDIEEWKNTPFSQRLFAVSADASYKLIEEKAKQKNYPDTIAGVDRFLNKYAKSERLGDALTLAGTAAMDSHQDQLAMKYFTRLIQDLPKSGSVKNALIARARIEESLYQLGEAAMDYRTYLRINGKPDPALQKKILALMWVNGDWTGLKNAVAGNSKDLCTADTATECQRYVALGALVKPDLFHFDLDQAFEKARKENGELAGLWAIVSLQSAKSLAFRDRLLAIRHTCQYWDDLDPLVKLSVLPYLNNSIPGALAMDRKMMNEVAPLRASEKYITHRVDVMREMENAVTLVMKLPWARIKAGAMNELAATYLDFSAALSNLQPKGLEGQELALYQETVRKITIPFEEKGQDLRGKAFQLGSQYAIEGTQLHLISDPFFADNPSQAKLLRKSASSSPVARSVDLDLDFMDIVDTTTGWKKIKANPTKADNTLAREFVRSLEQSNWPKVAYLLQEAKAKSAFKQPVLAAMRAISMASLGAQAEGLMELEQTRSQWEGKTQIFVLGTLSQYYEQSFASNRAQSFQKEIESLTAPHGK